MHEVGQRDVEVIAEARCLPRVHRTAVNLEIERAPARVVPGSRTARRDRSAYSARTNRPVVGRGATPELVEVPEPERCIPQAERQVLRVGIPWIRVGVDVERPVVERRGCGRRQDRVVAAVIRILQTERPAAPVLRRRVHDPDPGRDLSLLARHVGAVQVVQVRRADVDLLHEGSAGTAFPPRSAGA